MNVIIRRILELSIYASAIFFYIVFIESPLSYLVLEIINNYIADVTTPYGLFFALLIIAFLSLIISLPLSIFLRSISQIYIDYFVPRTTYRIGKLEVGGNKNAPSSEEKVDTNDIDKLKIEYEKQNKIIKDLEDSLNKIDADDGIYSKTRIRIKGLISQSSRQGFLNLTIAIIITILVGFVLFTAVLNADQHTTVQELAPRIFLSVSGQIVAFFFLALYRRGGGDQIMLHNEITNIDLMETAIDLAKNSPDKDLMTEVVKRLLESERNFKLGRGETTVAAARIQTDAQELRALLDAIAKTSNARQS